MCKGLEFNGYFRYGRQTVIKGTSAIRVKQKRRTVLKEILLCPFFDAICSIHAGL